MTTERRLIAILALTQVVSWGTLYYAFSVIALDMQRDLGLPNGIIFGAFSLSLLIAGMVAAPAGMLLDRHGGRPVMGSGSLTAGAGLAMLSQASGLVTYVMAWSTIGIAMALVLYEAAFATINREFESGARKGISTLTLFGGLASTVFWPVTLKLNSMLGWRQTWLLYAAIHIVICFPAHLLLVNRPTRINVHAAASRRSFSLAQAVRHPAFWKLALAFATNSFVFSALSVHLIPMLQRIGHPAKTVVFLAALIGPMQVAGRLGEMIFAGRTQPQAVGKLVFCLLPAAIAALLFARHQEWAVALFCVLYGLSNGIVTIVRGTVPQELFGRENYGAISGAMAGPALLAKAAGPLALAALIDASMTIAAIFWLLFACSIASLLMYLAAVRNNLHHEAVHPVSR